MNDDSKSREELIKELAGLRKQVSDQITIEVMLKAERERCQEYLDLAGVMFIIIDLKGTVILANRKACEVLEYSENEIIGKNWFDGFLPQNIRKRVKQVFDQLISGEIEPIEYFENPVISGSGAQRLIAWHNTILRDTEGSIIASLSSGEDITERKQSEEALRVSKERFEKIISQCPVPMVITDAKGDIEYFNDRFVKVFGYTLDDISTSEQWWITTYPDEDYRELVKRSWRFAIALAKEKGTQIETQRWDITCKDRSVRHVEFDMMPLGEISVIAMNDITKRNRAEDEREQAYAFLQTVIDGFPEELLVINRDYTIALANKTVRLQAEVDPVQACLKCHQISHHSETPCDNENHPCPLKEVFKTGKPVSIEHIHFNELGEERAVEIIASPIFDKLGVVIQIIESCRDITERKKTEEERLDLQRQILHTQKLESLGVLAGGIAHDFNNILMAILGNADLALQDLSTANPAYSNVKEIETASIRAADLARQMLAYSGKGQFLIERINLNEAVQEMTHMLEVSITKKAVIKYHLSDNLPLIDADATQIRQIIMNLVLNASDAIDRISGVISITTGAMDCDSKYLASAYIDESLPEGQYAYVEVTDTGSGMNEETLEKLFDPFFSTKFAGRGLGMSAVLGIIRGHRGAIKVYSEPGSGTSIKVLFPTCADSDELMEPDREGIREKWTCTGTVLLVDDEESILSIGKQMLERIGFDVLTALDGREALNQFREYSDVIDLVILDLTMPHLDGVETFREFRRVQSDVRVLISSGYNEQDVSQRFSGESLAGFLQKPYVLSELEAKIKEILAN